MKQRGSITLDTDVNKGIHDEATKQRLSFSTLVNKVLNEYLMALKKPKRGEKK